MIDPRITELAQQVLTPQQYEAWHLWEVQGYGYDRIALRLNISKSSARYRIQRAIIRLEPHLEAA